MWSKKARAAFRFLETEPTADETVIKRAYLRAAKKYHPDKNPADRENAERKFKELQDHMLVLKAELQNQAAESWEEMESSDENAPPVMLDEESWLDSMVSSFSNLGFDLHAFGIPLTTGRVPVIVKVSPQTMIEGGPVNVDLPCGAKVRLNVAEGTFSGEAIALRTASARYMVSMHPDLPEGAEDSGDLVSLVVEPLLTDLLLGHPVRLPLLDGDEERPLTEDEIRNGEVYVLEGGLPLPEGLRSDLRIIVRPVLPDASDPEQRQLLEALHSHLTLYGSPI